jgi:hypothetical protein
VRKLEDHFEGLEFHHISRDNNMAAEVLSKLGSKHTLVPAGVFVQDLCKPSIKLLSDPETSHNDTPGSRNVFMAEAEDDWRLNFIAYIVEKRIRAREDRQARRQLCHHQHRAIPEVCLQRCANEVHPPVRRS